MTTFFFAPESPRLTAMIRIALGLVLVGDGLANWRYAVELYSSAGPAMPIFVRQVDDKAAGVSNDAKRSRSTSMHFESLNPLPIPSPAVAVLAHTALVLAAGSVVLGWHVRTSLVAAGLLTAWLGPLDLPVTFGKQTVVALHILLLLAFSSCATVLSVDSLSDGNRTNRCLLSMAAPRRLMQVLNCCVYLGAALTKFKTSSFASGDLLTFSLLDYRWGSRWLGPWLTTKSHIPLLLSLATLFFEMIFPFLVWVPRLRRTMLGVAFAFHAAMGCLLSIGIFSAVMFAALLSFVEERDISVFERLFAFLPRPKEINSRTLRVHPLRSAVLHLAVLGILMIAGLLVQMQTDWYSVFGRRAPPALNEIATDEFSEMLAERPPAIEDYFHRIELGNRFGGNQVFGSSRKFQTGQRVYVLAQLIQPHPVIELEGLLIAPDGMEFARFTHRLATGVGYAIDGFELTDELPAGQYRIILQADDFVIAERRIELER